MKRVLPVSIVEFIDQAFDAEVGQVSGAASIAYEKVAALRVLIRLLGNLDSVLWPTGTAAHEFLIAWEEIRNHLDRWRGPDRKAWVGSLVGSADRPNAVYRIRQALRGAPDVVVPDSVAGLEFVEDAEYRARLREDIASAETSFVDGQFKAATILAGSVLEALVLLRIAGCDPAKVESAARDAGLRPQPLDERTLAPLIRIAVVLKLFTEETLRSAELAKDFRNLIHPGREQRKAARCNRGTAHQALAAMHLVIHEASLPGR